MYGAYWRKDRLDVYRFPGAGVEKIAGGPVAALKPIRSFGKKLLIVGSENTLHVRKRYPAIPEKDVEKAVRNEIEELFPISNPSFYCRIFEKEKMYVLVDIWAWNSAGAERVRGVFDFTYAVPEDLAYTPRRPEVVLYGTDEVANLAAYAEGKFLGSTSFVNSVTLEGLNLFLKSLGRYSAALKTLRVYGPRGFDLKGADLEVIEERERAYPFCLDHVGKLNLKDFRARSAELSAGIDIALRGALYVSLAYALSLFMTMRNYDASLNALSERLEALSKPLAASTTPKQGADYSETLKELEKKRNSRIFPLEVMDVLAERLPPKSYLVRLVINDKKAEAFITANEPLDVINAISKAKGVKSVKLKGAPTKDGRTGTYNLFLEVEL